MTLSELLAPLLVREFKECYYEQRPVRSKGSSARDFSKLLSLVDVDTLLTSSDLHYPCFRVVRNGRQVESKEVCRTMLLGSNEDSLMADAGAIVDQINGGATLVLQSLEHHWNPVSELCTKLQVEFPYLTDTIQANAYLTPRNSEGFAPHFDTHDVLILQCDGEKEWSIWGSPVSLPLTVEKQSYPAAHVREIAQRRPAHKFTLKPNDVLYIPRGFVHGAVTTSTRSLHITIGIIVPRLVDVILEACELALEHLEGASKWRRSAYQSMIGPDVRTARETYLFELRQEVDVLAAVKSILLGRKGILRTSPPGLITRFADGPQRPLGAESLIAICGETALHRVQLGTENFILLRNRASIIALPDNPAFRDLHLKECVLRVGDIAPDLQQAIDLAEEMIGAKLARPLADTECTAADTVSAS